MAVLVVVCGTLNPAVPVIPERSNKVEVVVPLVKATLFAENVNIGVPVSALATEPPAASCNAPAELNVEVADGV